MRPPVRIEEGGEENYPAVNGRGVELKVHKGTVGTRETPVRKVTPEARHGVGGRRRGVRRQLGHPWDTQCVERSRNKGCERRWRTVGVKG